MGVQTFIKLMLINNITYRTKLTNLQVNVYLTFFFPPLSSENFKFLYGWIQTFVYATLKYMRFSFTNYYTKNKLNYQKTNSLFKKKKTSSCHVKK